MADWSDVAHLDFSQPGLRDYISDMMAHWVGKVGIDGFRCDVAGMVPLDFWTDVRKRLDAIKPVLMLAEDSNPAQHLAAFDLTYDFNGYYTLEPLGNGTMTVADFAGLQTEEHYEFPAGSLRMRYSSNHDMCAWLKPGFARYGPAGARAAAVLTYALPGIPLIYTGQELANTKPLPLFERVPIDWSTDDQGLGDLFTDLARLRRERESLRSGHLRLEAVDGDNQVLALVRSQGPEVTYVVVNLSNADKEVTLDKESAGAKTLLAAKQVKRTDQTPTLHLPPLAYWIAGK